MRWDLRDDGNQWIWGLDRSGCSAGKDFFTFGDIERLKKNPMVGLDYVLVYGG